MNASSRASTRCSKAIHSPAGRTRRTRRTRPPARVELQAQLGADRRVPLAVGGAEHTESVVCHPCRRRADNRPERDPDAAQLGRHEERAARRSAEFPAPKVPAAAARVGRRETSQGAQSARLPPRLPGQAVPPVWRAPGSRRIYDDVGEQRFRLLHPSRGETGLPGVGRARGRHAETAPFGVDGRGPSHRGADAVAPPLSGRRDRGAVRREERARRGDASAPRRPRGARVVGPAAPRARGGSTTESACSLLVRLSNSALFGRRKLCGAS